MLKIVSVLLPERERYPQCLSCLLQRVQSVLFTISFCFHSPFFVFQMYFHVEVSAFVHIRVSMFVTVVVRSQVAVLVSRVSAAEATRCPYQEAG